VYCFSNAVGRKHPEVLGKPVREVWSEIFDIIHPMLLQVLETGEPTWSEDQLLMLTRNNVSHSLPSSSYVIKRHWIFYPVYYDQYPEESYFTWSYSPIRDETGKISGVLSPVCETTKRVITERRLGLLRELGNKVRIHDLILFHLLLLISLLLLITVWTCKEWQRSLQWEHWSLYKSSWPAVYSDVLV